MHEFGQFFIDFTRSSEANRQMIWMITCLPLIDNYGQRFHMAMN